MLESLLIANRGEIARRVIRTARRLGIRTIAVYSEADASSPHVAEADEAVLLGPAPAGESYLDVEKIVRAAKKTGAAAVHPGYGFLSENSEFLRRVEQEGIVWVGPTQDAIRSMGHKIQARNLMSDAGVPVTPGTREAMTTIEDALDAASDIGYPVIVKAAAAGGGMGMGIADDEAQLRAVFERAVSQGSHLFGNPDVLLERYVRGARHVEAQILGLADGSVVALGERDCSVQRRHQKVVEEAPAASIPESLRESLLKAAVRAGEAVGYRNAGTVEFLVDPVSQEFFFMEMNTRLQVEHPVTELIFGVDLVEEQLRIASGLEPTFGARPPRPGGHAVELRIYAENPAKRFLPSPGVITSWVEPSGPGVRVDAGYAEGNEVTPFYDPMLAKLCVFAPDRAEAIARALRALDEFEITGPKTNLSFLKSILSTEEFNSNIHDTGLIERMQSNGEVNGVNAPSARSLSN